MIGGKKSLYSATLKEFPCKTKVVLGVKAFMMVRQTEQKQNVFSVKKKKHQ
jgi:hypothetical protein